MTTHDPRAVRVDIGELVLDGFDTRVDPERVSAAFQTELGRLVREHGVPIAVDDRGQQLEALGGLPPLPATTSPARIGRELARAVHAGLSGHGTSTAAESERSGPATGRGRRR